MRKKRLELLIIQCSVSDKSPIARHVRKSRQSATAPGFLAVLCRADRGDGNALPVAEIARWCFTFPLPTSDVIGRFRRTFVLFPTSCDFPVFFFNQRWFLSRFRDFPRFFRIFRGFLSFAQFKAPSRRSARALRRADSGVRFKLRRYSLLSSCLVSSCLCLVSSCLVL